MCNYTTCISYCNSVPGQPPLLVQSFCRKTTVWVEPSSGLASEM